MATLSQSLLAIDKILELSTSPEDSSILLCASICAWLEDPLRRNAEERPMLSPVLASMAVDPLGFVEHIRAPRADTPQKTSLSSATTSTLRMLLTSPPLNKYVLFP